MSFDNTVLQDHVDLPAGEVIKDSPHNVSAFEQFEDGLVEGRFAKFEGGQVDNLDGSSDPTIPGIVKRKVTGEIGPGVYSTSGQEIDQVAEVINFGYATVTVTDAADPSQYDPVNVINDGTADAGKATEAAVAAGIISAGNVVFWRPTAPNTWLVQIKQFL